MNLPLTLMIVCCFQPLTLDAQGKSDGMDNYRLGNDVGECVVMKCQVFRGHLVTDSPKSGQLVTIKVDEVFFGLAAGQDVVRIPYSKENWVKAPSESPGYAWRKVTLAGSENLTIVQALDRLRAVEAGAPVFVTEEEGEVAIIRRLTEQAHQLEKSPDAISTAVSSIYDPATAGFLDAQVRHLALKDPELAAVLFQQMIGNPNVPAPAWNQIANYMILDYYRLSESGKGSVVTRFTELAQEPDLRTGALGFTGLARLATSNRDIPTLIPSAVQARLAQSYRALVAKGSMRRDPSLEMELGIVY